MVIEKLDASHIDWKVPIERSVLINTDIDNATLRLYLILLSYARDKITAFPSRETLAADMGCSVRNIDLIKNKLKKHDLLRWETRFNGVNQFNIYTLLQYEPIKKKSFAQREKKIAGSSGKKLPGNNKQYKNIINKPETKEVADAFIASYKKFCLSTEEKALAAKDLIQTDWHKNPNYNLSRGDINNLTEFYQQNGETGVKKLKICFQFLDKYLEDNIGYSEFHNSEGKELVPTISLFIKAKMQYNNLINYVREELEYKLEYEKNNEKSSFDMTG